MRYHVQRRTLDVRPWPTYWFVAIDTGKLCHNTRTSQAYYQNYDEDYYRERAQWCMYTFGYESRTAYNQYYFKTREQFEQFRLRWL